MGRNKRSKTFIFHNTNTTTTGTGNILSIFFDDVTMTLDITGSGTATLVFEGCSNSDLNYRPIMGINLSTFEASNTTSNLNTLWQFSLEGLIKFRVNVTAISGNIKIVGTVVD